MKLRSIISVFLGLLMCLFASVAAAYPTHLNGDPNYILVDANKDVGYYVDKTSLNVQQYAPPCYIISINVVSAVSTSYTPTDFSIKNWSGRITGVQTYRFFYNYDDTAMYYDTTGHDGWEKLSPLGSWADTGIRRPAGEMAFYLAYNMKFYGAYKWSGNGLKNVVVYDKSFYDRVN